MVFRLFILSKKESGYREHIAERFALDFKKKKLPQAAKWIWVHAVSVGETMAAEPFIAQCLSRFPNAKIVLTSMSPAGRSTGQRLFGKRCEVRYLPYDLTYAVSRFLQFYRPCIGVILETEMWPTLLHEAQVMSIPMFLVNARKSLKSYQKARRLGFLTQSMYGLLQAVFAQTALDAKYFQALGAKTVTVMGNLKFDMSPPSPDLIACAQRWKSAFSNRLIWLAASTHEGEEQIILDAWEKLRIPNLLLIIVPRHIKRFAEVEQLLLERQIQFVKRSECFIEGIKGEVITSQALEEVQVLLGDSMGELIAYYAMSDLALVAGSLLPYGGHNLIEATVVGVPVLIGTHVFNMVEMTQMAVASGAALQVQDAEDLAKKVKAVLLHAHVHEKMHQAALRLSAPYQGVAQRLVAQLAVYVDEPKNQM